MKILLLEDEVMLNNSICEFLSNLGHIAYGITDGKEAYEAIDESFDLLIFDINVPQIDGFELLEKLNAKNFTIPVIYISALTDMEDISKGYELGALEYMKKPFHLEELGIKINQIIKREQSTNTNHILFSKNYSYSKLEKTLYYQGEPQNLTKKQLNIIHILALNINMIVDFERFRMDVWDGELIDNPTIRAEISRLNKSLKEDFIKNVRGLGYKIEKFYP
ncbi:MAG: response regulator transcription factor [Arcobacteraceae bacterium]|jgi:two-component system OmpR family response regulator|nr:response regulator transcription factor [Arcobacteraceae bacterium]MDY0364832.1 response regulator transcription factor [Arcobacteraceae bacterium]